MRLVPFTASTALRVVIISVLPVAPLLLTMFSVEELFQTLLKFLF